jgi:hypothetical protein
MTALAARILAPALLESDDLGTAPLVKHFGRDGGAGDGRRTEHDAVAADDEHFAEFDDLTGFALDLVDLEHIFRGNAVLLATCLEDREHLFFLVFGFQYSARCRTGFFQSMLLLKLLILASADKPNGSPVPAPALL